LYTFVGNLIVITATTDRLAVENLRGEANYLKRWRSKRADSTLALQLHQRILTSRTQEERKFFANTRGYKLSTYKPNMRYSSTENINTATFALHIF
jgi:hypothetical protein